MTGVERRERTHGIIAKDGCCTDGLNHRTDEP